MNMLLRVDLLLISRFPQFKKVCLVKQLPCGHSDATIGGIQARIVRAHVLAHQQAVISEEQIDLLKSPAGYFGIEEVDDRGRYGIHGPKEKKGDPSQASKHDWNDETCDPTSDRPSQDSHAVSFGANFLRPDLSPKKPAGHDVEHGKRPQKDERERRRCCPQCSGLRMIRGSRVLRSLDEAAHQKQADSLSNEGYQKRLSPSEAVDHQRCSGGSKYAEGVDESRQPTGFVCIEASE